MEISQLYAVFQAHPVVTTDSRRCPEGSIFFALKGDNFDGNKFAAKALEAGCSYAVVDDGQYIPQGDTRYILTTDVLKTLQQLARHHRRRLGTRIVGITGTNGKTTTKELLGAVLAKQYNVLCTQGNLNNHIGVPLTLLRLTDRHDIAVVEMGASHPGDIRELVDIAEPDYGLITNVGRAHLQGFGSFEGVCRTKGELYDFLRRRRATVFIDALNPYLMPMARGLQLVTYAAGAAHGLMVEGEVMGCDPFLSFRWRRQQEAWHRVDTHLIGSYNITNMLAAATVGLFFGVSEEQVSEALAGYVPGNNRSQLEVTETNNLIVDTYNANPTSMAAALDNFALVKADAKMAIIGDMKELGEVSHEEHCKVVGRLAAMPLDEVWLVGSEFARVPLTQGRPFRHFADVNEVIAAIREHQPRHRCILIKGSNSTRLFEVPKEL